MAGYELIIEQRQPTCGGRAPTKCEIRAVTTDDPIAYVQALEPFVRKSQNESNSSDRIRP